VPLPARPGAAATISVARRVCTKIGHIMMAENPCRMLNLSCQWQMEHRDVIDLP
jgi:hypothetical protein